ncbi:MAG: hypothetical protein J5I91_07660 [Bacteroidetes bacterium]|nr:hypothetical protein [Bacteroidota bacterium]
MNFRVLLCVCFLFSLGSTFAQLPNHTFYVLENENGFIPKRINNENVLDKLNPFNRINRQLYLDFQTLFFVKNNEYFSNIEPGETYFGYQFYPTIVWKPFKNSDFRLKGGLYLQKNFGDIGFANHQVTFTLDYQYKHTRFVLGTLYGGLEHRLIEPLYRFERGLYDRIENGFQITHLSKRFFADIWINWRQTVNAKSNRQEILEPGLSLYYYLSGNKESSFSIKAIAQMTNQHKGGSSVGLPLVNHTNNALGFDFTLGNINHIRWTFQPYLLHALDHSIELQQPYKDGMGIYLNGGFYYKHFTFITSYWKGWEYFSSLGTPLFNSFNYDNYYTLERERELIFFRFIYSKPLINNNLNLDLRIEPLYEISAKKFQHSMGIYFIYRIGV